MGGAGSLLGADRERYGLDLEVVNPSRRPDLRVHDARLGRQDPDGLLVAVRDGRADRLKDRFDVAFGNDPDADRHGIVTPSAGC
jgi:phosphoglucomutase